MKRKINIVKSSTEPSRDDIWLKDGKIKQFKNGWKDLGSNEFKVTGTINQDKTVCIYEKEPQKIIEVRKGCQYSVSFYNVDGLSDMNGITLIGKDVNGNEIFSIPPKEAFEDEASPSIIELGLDYSIISFSGVSKSWNYENYNSSPYDLYVVNGDSREEVFYSCTVTQTGDINVQDAFDYLQSEIKKLKQ